MSESSAQSSPTLSMRLAIFFVLLYQYFIQPMIRVVLIATMGHYSACKHSPTCSQYTINQIKTHGTIRGLKKGLIRIWNCR